MNKAFWAAGVRRRVAVRVVHTVGITSIASNTDLLVVVPHRLARACVELGDVGARTADRNSALSYRAVLA